MTAIRIIDDHVQLASIGSKTHVQIEGHIQGIGNYAFPAADGGADQVLKTNGAGVLAWIDKNHSIASHNDTSATGAQLDTLVDNSIADALHRHSELVASDGSPDPVVSVDADGNVGVTVADDTKGAGLTVKNSDGSIELSNATSAAGKFEGGLISKSGGAINSLLIRGVRNALQTAAHACVDLQGSNAAQDGAIASADILLIIRNFGTYIASFMGNGNICFGTSAPVTSAKLELSSTTGALLLTRMTTTQRDALTAVNGMLIYNSTLNKFQGYENGAWTSLI